jgi:hypothetical protein
LIASTGTSFDAFTWQREFCAHLGLIYILREAARQRRVAEAGPKIKALPAARGRHKGGASHRLRQRSIDDEIRSRDAARERARQEHDTGRDLFGRAHAPCRIQGHRRLVEIGHAALDILPDAAFDIGVARRHGVDADILRGELVREALGVMDERRFDGPVRACREIHLEARDARDDRDRCACRFFEMRERCRHGVHRVHHVCAEGFLPGLGRVADGERADIADERVDAAELLGGGFDPLGERGSIGDVDGLAEALDALLGQRLRGRIDLSRLAGADGDIRPFGREEIADRSADPLAASGDQCVLAFELKIHLRLRSFPRICRGRSRRDLQAAPVP